MQDYPDEENLSVWNPPGAGRKAMDKDIDPEEEEKTEEKTEEKK